MPISTPTQPVLAVRVRSRSWPVIIAFAFLMALFSLSLRAQAAPPSSADVQPQARIDLSLVGFHGLSPSARLAEQSNMSLDFLDDDHLLVTFNPKKMFTRQPDCPPTHDDRMIHAAILTVPDGRVVKEADWYLHDHQRYIWALGSGHFLLRRLNTLYLVDSTLGEKLLLNSPQPFLWISVTADGKQIVLERKQDDGAQTKAKTQGKSAKPAVKIEFTDIATLAVQRVIKSEGIANLEALSTGFADVIHSKMGNVWLVRFGPSGKQRENITRVRSHCVPDIVFSSGNTLMVGRCAMNSSDYSVSAFTVTGHFLWRQHWSDHRYTPKLRRSEDGSRVAVSSVARIMPADKPPTDEAEAGPDSGLRQHVQVLDTASGSAVISVEAAEPSLAAQNIALAPDGRHLALLQGSTLAIYNLPEMSAEDRARYIAAKNDVPGLYVAADPTPSGSTPEETTFAAVDTAEEANQRDAEKPNAPGASGQPAVTDPPKTEAAQPSPASTTPVADAIKTDSALPALTLRATAHVVVEDVVVTDSKGHPVQGLTAKDFQLTEDGQPQNVRAFDEYPKTEVGAAALKSLPSSASAPAQPSANAPTPAPKLPQNVYTNSSTDHDTGSSTIVVLDLLNTPMTDQHRAREQLINFIKKRPEASQMALCALSSNLRLIQGFTHDDNVLLAAAHGKKGGVKAPPWQSDSGLERSVQLARDVALVAGTQGSILSLQRAQNSVDQQKANDLDTRMRFTLDGFTQLARYLSGIPGRKNLVWLSGSFPLSMFPNPDVTYFEPVTRNYEGDVKKVTNLLAEAHVAVYPVSVKGIEAQSMFSAANSGAYESRALPGQNGPNQAAATSPVVNVVSTQPLSSRMDRETRDFQETLASEHSSMDQMATETGGKAFYNSNGIEDAIQTATDEGAHYYTLSYTPGNKNYEGAFRKIKVSLQEKGYHLAFRRGYYAVDPDAGSRDTRDPAQRIGVAAMQQGAPQSRQIVFATRVVPLGKARKGETTQATAGRPATKKNATAGPVLMQHYGIDFAIDASDLRFAPTVAGLYHSVLSFMVTAFNDDDRLVASLVSIATSDLKPANYKDVMTGGFRLHQEIDVPTEAVSLRLGVEDSTSSRVGTLEIALPVPVPPDLPQVMTHSLPPIEPD